MTDNDSMDETHMSITHGSSRRRFLAAGLTGAVGLVAGCQAAPGDGETTEPGPVTGDPPWYGSGPGAFDQRPEPGGRSMTEMPDLSGTLRMYSGRGETLVGDLVTYLGERYPDFEPRVTYDTAQSLATQVDTEGENTPADVFYSVNAGALGFLADKGHTRELADGTVDLVDSRFRADDGAWTGTSGRARTIPYNTEALSESDIPTDIMAFPELTGFAGEIGWAPVYSSYQGFVTAMIELEGEAATRQWLQEMGQLVARSYSDEFAIAQAVADGDLALGFTNHYYIQRVLAGRPDAPLGTAFTEGDAGAVFNVAGAARLAASDSPDQADLLVRHLLSSEAQEYFAIRTFEYPMVAGVEPVGRLPPIDELNVPDIDLSALSNLDDTVQVLRDEGVL